MKQVRTRFAPSPTGYLHIGGVRTALFCWLYARKHEGRYILRIEDTDRERSTQAATDAIIEGLSWLGLDADEKPYYQSERLDRYREVAAKLLELGHAYHCYCTRHELEALRSKQISEGEKPRYNRCCRERLQPKNPDIAPVIRFKTPVTGDVVFNDKVHGKILVRNQELDDFIILRSDDTPTYNFTVVVDDADMKISHVIRGDDHINNTPRQIHLFNALNANIPEFAHLPMINGQDGHKLSKRHGAVSVLEYKQDGFLAQALLNYLARLGWSHGDQELFSLDELIEYFDIQNINKSSASFDREKLLWINQHYIKQTPAKKLIQILSEQLIRLGYDPGAGPDLTSIVQIYREKAKTMREMAEQVGYLYNNEINYDPTAVKKFFNQQGQLILNMVLQKLSMLSDWNIDNIAGLIRDVVSESGFKFPNVAQPLRIALTGCTNSPSIDQTLWLVGADKSILRITQAINHIDNHM